MSPSTVARAGSIFAIIGAPKASVLPVPVSALAITSRPSSTGPIASAWIGVGVVMSMFLIARWISSPRFHSSKLSISGGFSTGWSSAMCSRRGPPRFAGLGGCDFGVFGGAVLTSMGAGVRRKGH